MKNLSGDWVMNKDLSDDFDPVLNLQGVGWLARKAIGFATLTIHMKQYVGDDGVTRIDIIQTGSGGIKGTNEPRTLDWQQRAHSDNIFGNVMGQSRFVSINDISEPFLKEGWLEGPEEATATGETHVESLATNAEKGWTADQIWGFMMVDGKRRHCRKVLCKKGDKKVTVRLVYDYVN